MEKEELREARRQMFAHMEQRLQEMHPKGEDRMFYFRSSEISEYVVQKQAAGDKREMQEIAVEYNDTVIYPDKVRLNKYYLDHYSFIKDIQMIVCTVLGKKMEYAGEEI